jgi:predicted Zn-dependent protease with MMP-like domain
VLIKGDILAKYFSTALQCYKDYNKGSLPDHIFIYRDGVGDAMRDMVINEELS